MGDVLSLGGGSTIRVDVDELLTQASRLAASASIVEDWRRRAVGARATAIEHGHTYAASDALASLDDLERLLVLVAEEAADVRGALIEVAANYGIAERDIAARWQVGGEIGAWWLGATALLWLPMVASSAAGIWAGRKVASAVYGDERADAATEQLLKNLLGHPGVVRLVGATADSVDDFSAGVLGLPAVPGFGGAENAAVLAIVAGLIGGGRRFPFVERDVTIRSADRAAAVAQAVAAAPGAHPARAAVVAPTNPPKGFGDLADRIPNDGETQIRIERFGTAGDQRFIVYIGGTLDPAVHAGAQPFDATNNITAMAQAGILAAVAPDGAGERAVRLAMIEAGVEPGDEVLAVGHSAGGMIAALLANDPTSGVHTAINFGGPEAAAHPSPGAKALQFAHAEDLVPMSGGAGQPSAQVLTVQRDVADGAITGESILPAHALTEYQRTAALADDLEAPDLETYREAIAEITRGEQPTRTDWIATRVPLGGDGVATTNEPVER